MEKIARSRSFDYRAGGPEGFDRERALNHGKTSNKSLNNKDLSNRRERIPRIRRDNRIGDDKILSCSCQQ
jgi:hypothetical protein